MLLLIFTLMTLFFGCVLFAALSAASAYWGQKRRRPWDRGSGRDAIQRTCNSQQDKGKKQMDKKTSTDCRLQTSADCRQLGGDSTPKLLQKFWLCLFLCLFHPSKIHQGNQLWSGRPGTSTRRGEERELPQASRDWREADLMTGDDWGWLGMTGGLRRGERDWMQCDVSWAMWWP